MNHQLPPLPCSLEQMLLLASMMQLVFGMTVGILKPTCIRANIKQFVPQSVLCIGVLCSCCIVLSFILSCERDISCTGYDDNEVLEFSFSLRVCV